MTNTYRLTQSVKEGTLEYSLDKYDEYAVLEIFSDTLDAEQLKAKLLIEYPLKDIIIKEVFDCKKTIISGECPEKITVIENDFKFIVRLKLDDVGLPLSKAELRKLIQTYSVNKEVLDLFGYNGNASIYANAGKPKSIDVVENDIKFIQKIKKNFEINSMDLPQIWDTPFSEFLDLAQESKTKWNLIIMDFSSYNTKRLKEFILNTDHRDLIKRVQEQLLKEAGIIIVVADQKDFVMDQYIRPGADKLTNQLIPEAFRPLKPNQIFAFYN